MSARRLEGAPLAARLADETAAGVRALVARGPPAPGLRLVRVGDDEPSRRYAARIRRAALATGIGGDEAHLPAACGQAALEAAMAKAEADPAVDGVLLLQPLPAGSGLDARAALALLSARKDVDGAGAENVWLLAHGDPAAMVPATPAAGMALLGETGLPLEGAQAVVVGRSGVVGKPLALLLLRANATVTICHSRTRHLAEHTRRADVLAVAAGRAGLVTPEMVRPGAVVLDFGINPTPDGLVGDVDPAAEAVAGWLTPVPGGIGPLTVQMLLQAVLRSARQRR